MKNITYLAAAYGIAWAGLFAYLWHVVKKQETLARRIRALEETD